MVKRAERSLILVPARGRCMSGEPVSFLFSIAQLEDIVGAVSISKVPFSDGYLDGLAGWRRQVLPVISLEVLFGFAARPLSYGGTRAIVARANNVTGTGIPNRALLRVSTGCRMTGTVPDADPVDVQTVCSGRAAAAMKGVYQWEGGMLVLPDLDFILSGKVKYVRIHHT